MIDQESVRTALIHYRKDNGLSLREVGRLTGISPTTMSRLSRGVGILDMNNLCRLAQFVGLPINGYECDGNTLPNIKAAIDRDDNLGAGSKETLFEIMSVAYRQFVKD